MSIFYIQECPTCGRQLQIRVDYLGRKVVCQHCRGSLIAADPAMRSDSGDNNHSLLQRAEKLLASVAKQKMSATQHPR